VYSTDESLEGNQAQLPVIRIGRCATTLAVRRCRALDKSVAAGAVWWIAANGAMRAPARTA